jgi:hypothetical protein
MRAQLWCGAYDAAGIQRRNRINARRPRAGPDGRRLPGPGDRAPGQMVVARRLPTRGVEMLVSPPHLFQTRSSPVPKTLVSPGLPIVDLFSLN